ncbi:MAG: multicopper oxidase domain-containing protein [Nitrospiraceae bacterium]|nr:MAG: multicopper oxidase domain-containing protein [Nitrospiraceae bacterium]
MYTVNKLLMVSIFTVLGLSLIVSSGAMAQPVPGGTLDPLTIPKYVTPLVIPPVMKNDGAANSYDIAVRQFNQQILPAGFPSTTVWSYGPAADPVPAIAAPDPASQFNYPAYTIETTADTAVNVRWRNDLVAIDPITGFPCDGVTGSACAPTFLPHLLPIDQTLHWANPPGPIDSHCMGTVAECQAPYTGPVPIITHVHGAHVMPHSDGYPEAWWLPAASNIPPGYFTEGTLFTDANGQLPANSGFADFSYLNTQPATTLWYHDHTLGMTRSNVYAGPAGFWLVRGDYTAPDTTVVPDAVDNGITPAPNDGILPGPAPVAGQGVVPLNTPGNPVRNSIREIPIVIQDRSFNADGSLFYPDNRAFFEGLNVPGQPQQFPGAGELQIPFETDPASDIAPIWNPEAFFNVIVVNGVSWPTMQVAPAIYRLRLLNGCNSRFLNLKLFEVNKTGRIAKEQYIYQIGGDQGFLPQVVEIKTGKATPLPGDGLVPLNRINAKYKDQALLLGLAERADVLVDFRGKKNGTIIRMVNTAPDAPFGGFPDIPADPATTGQVMQFVVNTTLNGASATDPLGLTPATGPYSLKLNTEPALAAPINSRFLSLNEEESALLCVNVDALGNIVVVPGTPPLCLDPVTGLPTGLPMAPKAALLGGLQCVDAVTGLPTATVPPACNPATEVLAGVPKLWSDDITERPIQGNTEQWDIYNLTVDGHPIHLHLVRYEVVDRQLLDPITMLPVGLPMPPEANETGYKDTVIAYPGEVTRLKAKFDIAGLYVWHCHIVEHEDNEMMRPFCVDAVEGGNSCPKVP